MITRIRFENYRSHGATDFSLQPINLLIGAVAAGKSNVFKGLLLIQNSINRSLVELFPPGLGEFQWVKSRWAGESDPIGFEVELTELTGYPGQIATYTTLLADLHRRLTLVPTVLRGNAVPAALRLFHHWGAVD